MTSTRPRRLASLSILALAGALAGCGEVPSVSVNATPRAVLEPAAPAEPAPKPAAPGPKDRPGEKPKAAPAAGPTALAAIATVAAAPTPAAEVRLDAIPYDQLKARITAQRGAKLTMMDVWSTTCAPCKENFPHVVQMHARLASKGLAVISLSMDPPDEPEAVRNAEAFLREKKATFTNLRLAEDPAIVYEKLEFFSLPAVFLFGPDGTLLKKFTWDDPNHQFTYDEVEKAVEAQLNAAGKG